MLGVFLKSLLVLSVIQCSYLMLEGGGMDYNSVSYKRLSFLYVYMCAWYRQWAWLDEAFVVTVVGGEHG